MIFQTESNFYEILEILPDASAQDIRNAYLRLKASYRKDNPALYSVLDPSETENMIHKIEEAFAFLSDPDSRREYDERNGFSDRIERKIFSIDRPLTPSQNFSAPMESADEMDILVAPTTDFDGMQSRGESTLTGVGAYHLPTQAPPRAGFLETLPSAEKPPTPTIGPDPSRTNDFIERRETTYRRESDRQSAITLANPQIDAIAAELIGETEWRGSTLRRIRELRKYSLDDIAAVTKISKNYLVAIEEEAFTKLPAPVFVRGFLLQIARTLKIPVEPVAVAYLARFSKRSGST